ncbi:NUDIX hydrolase [Lutispora thermophila]|uniref:8-oxo-dGTP diphosphatase n=1 Tax=Lutispora thermophila DSM 19022 TaxID=1122184 RepID=A0A1M6CK67_9FIRM|nr:NUDIX domain-containing protein [Lutispora thermophila]SHI61396.1 8-oxo-dGTP diphosphatase [Lutispora thermophila DSM 19022]
MNLEVKFYDEIEDENLKFAVIMARYDSKWIFCKHKERDTYEIPGGHRETGESIFDTAKRELQEETGAIDFEFEPVSVYSVTGKSRVNSKGDETFGMLFYAEVHSFKDRLEDEIEKIELFSNMPNNLTYPEIQPFLYNKVIETKINDNGLKSFDSEKIE